MAHSNTSLTLALALALGAMACGGSDKNVPPPQTPSNTTTTTAGYGASSGATNPSSTSSYGQTGEANANNPQTAGTVTGTPTSETPSTGAQQATGAAQPSGSMGTSGTSTTMGAGAGTSSNDVTLTDAQISGVTGAANTAEIDQAREALKKAKSPKVKQFAQRMITDHTQLENKGKQVDKKVGITPQDSEVSNQLKASASQIASTLRSSSGADFDRAYIDAQVNEHQQVLDVLDSKLIPQAQNQELKTALERARDKIADHLKMAKDIQASLNK